jgi:transforming growth factor-beta-induced protein
MDLSISKSKALIGGIIALAIAFSLLLPVQQASATGMSRGDNIAQIAIKDGRFTTLVKALQCTGLDKVVSSNYVRLTVFAPTDAAFSDLGLNSGNVCETFSKRDLRNILLYHVTLGAKDSTVVLSSKSIRMLNWQKAPINASVPSIANAEINVGLIDIKASNGIVHVLNDVMLP